MSGNKQRVKQQQLLGSITTTITLLIADNQTFDFVTWQCHTDIYCMCDYQKWPFVI